MGAPVYHYTGQVAPRFEDSGLLEEWKWCHNVMVEADIHLRPLYTSMLDTYNMFEPLVCSLKSIWVHPNTVTLANLAPDLGVQVYLRSGNDATTCHGWGWTTSYIHSRHIQCVWSISSMLSQGHMVVPLYHYTHQVSPRFGKAGSLEEWKWCLNVMVEADIHLRPLHTSMIDIYKKFLSHWYAVLRVYGCTLIPLHWPNCPQIWEAGFT